MDECKGRQDQATKHKERPKFQVATGHGVDFSFDSAHGAYGVERSFPLYAPCETDIIMVTNSSLHVMVCIVSWLSFRASFKGGTV